MTKQYIYQETTQWADSSNANHVYVFKEKIKGRSATAVAYMPVGNTQVLQLRTPLKLDLKGRTFRELA
jgi:hypothetical protein